MSEVVAPPIRWRSLLILLIACGVVAGGIQFVEVINDNSVRNAISLIAGMVAYVGAIIWLYRNSAPRISRLLAVPIALSLVFLPLILFRIKGFSGEIIPQIEWRFASPRQLSSEPIRLDEELDWLLSGADDFGQFLGPDRNGLLTRRDFRVPEDELPEPLWKIKVGDGWSGFAVAEGRCVTLEQRGEEECVVCYRLADGELVWIDRESARHQNPLGGIGPRSTPTIHQGRVYTQGATGIVQCLDLRTGESIWRVELLPLAGWTQAESERRIAWGRAGSPLLAEGLCVLPFGGPESLPAGAEVDGVPIRHRGLIALDAEDGRVRWVAGDDQISFASPVRMTLAGVDQIVIVNERSVSGHEIATGEPLWTTGWPGQSSGSANCSSAIQVDDTAFLVGKAYGIGSAIFEVSRDESGWSVRDRWRLSNVLKTKFSHATIKDGYAYGLSDGTLECVDLETGKRSWAQPRGSRFGHGQSLLVEDVLVIQAESGEVAFVDARSDRFEPRLIGRALSSKTWNVPAVAGRFLLVRNDVEAIAYELPPR